MGFENFILTLCVFIGLANEAIAINPPFAFFLVKPSYDNAIGDVNDRRS